MRKSKIERVDAIEVLDSRGFPTLQVAVTTEEGICGQALVPSGASKGENEACELRDGQKNRFGGFGVQKAVRNVKEKIHELFHGENVLNQQELDRKLISADGSKNKSVLGANAILGASLALAKAGSATLNVPLYRYIGGLFPPILPCPMMNIINGGRHADNGLEFQEFMIRPIGASSFAEAVRFGAEIFHTLKKILKEKGLPTQVGDEGGFAPKLSSNIEALELILEAIERAGYVVQKQITLAIDCASSEFFEKGTYNGRNSQQQVDYLVSLTEKYPIDTIEDGMSENDWEGWQLLTKKLSSKIQLVGDDIFVTNREFLQKGLEKGVANSILIKPNQIGTLTETIECIRLAQSHSYTTIISHRSGETEDTSIADIAVGTGAGQIKTGSLSRSERIAKYNRLISIEASLEGNSIYRDSNRCRSLGRSH